MSNRSVEANYRDFPDCMHALAAAFHMNRIDPAKATIALPFDEWWRLYSALERKLRGLMVYDGRGVPGVDLKEFRYMGFRFVVAVDEIAAANHR